MVVPAFSSYAFNAASLWSLSGIKLWWIMVSLDDVREGSTFKVMQSTVMSIFFYVVYSVWFTFTFFDLLSTFSFHLFFHHSVLPTLILKWDSSKWNRIRERRVPAAMDQESCAHSFKVQMWRYEELTLRGVHSASLKPLLNINLERDLYLKSVKVVKNGKTSK